MQPIKNILSLKVWTPPFCVHRETLGTVLVAGQQRLLVYFSRGTKAAKDRRSWDAPFDLQPPGGTAEWSDFARQDVFRGLRQSTP